MEPGMDIEAILRLLPHRYPFVLVDRVLCLEPGVRIRALKNVTINEPFFQGHFPDRPIMPGVLILEGMVQTAALLLARDLSPLDRFRVCFTGFDRTRFRRPVSPGDQLLFEAHLLKQRSSLMKMRATAVVEARLAAETDILALVMTGGKP